MKLPKRLRPLSEIQTRIMKIIWDRGEASVSDIQAALATDTVRARNTVQTLLSRLERKGWLKHREQGNTFYYYAAVGQRKTLAEMIRRLVDTAFGGSSEGLVMALLDERNITAEEARRIKAMIGKAVRHADIAKSNESKETAGRKS